MTKGIILLLGVVSLSSCSVSPKNRTGYFCSTPIGMIIAEPDKARRDGGSVFVKDDNGKEAEIAFSNCLGVSSPEEKN